MSDDQSVFNAKPNEDPSPQVVDVFADQLNMIKNESGEPKYDSVPKALEALQHSQQYIPEIKSQLHARDQEIATLKEQLSGASTLDDVMAKFNANQEQAPEDTQTPPNALDEQAIIKLIRSQSNQDRQQTVATTNEAAVSKVLVEKFGDKATEALTSKASELGMTIETMKTLAQQSPNAVLQFFGTSNVAPQQTVQSSVTTQLTPPKEGGLEKPEKSLMAGAKYGEQLGYLNKVRQEVYKKHGVET